jgi:hypothetical protein
MLPPCPWWQLDLFQEDDKVVEIVFSLDQFGIQQIHYRLF